MNEPQSATSAAVSALTRSVIWLENSFQPLMRLLMASRNVLAVGLDVARFGVELSERRDQPGLLLLVRGGRLQARPSRVQCFLRLLREGGEDGRVGDGDERAEERDEQVQRAVSAASV